MKITDLYESLLKVAGMAVNSEGYVSLDQVAGPDPAVIKGKRLVLPLQEHLMKPEGKVIFHPLKENILRKGESEVMEYYRKALNMRLNQVMGLVAATLMQKATSPKEHSSLTPDQSEFLRHVKDANEKMYNTLKKLLAAMPMGQSQKAFVSIYLKPAGQWHGKQYNRVGIVTFPLYVELKKEKGPGTVFGVKVGAAEREVLINLLEYMIPDIGTAEAHNYGSNDITAPFIDALMKSFLTVAAPLNNLIDLFGNVIEESDSIMFDAEWVEVFDNLEVMIPQIRMIPMQAGNEGTPTQVAEVPAAAPAPVAAVPAAHHHMYVPPAPGQQAPAAYMAPPPQQFAPQAPQRGKNGVDFMQLLHGNPQLAQQAAQMHQPMWQQQQGQNQGPSMPRWAQQQQPQFQQQGGWQQQQQPQYQSNYGGGTRI